MMLFSHHKEKARNEIENMWKYILFSIFLESSSSGSSPQVSLHITMSFISSFRWCPFIQEILGFIDKPEPCNPTRSKVISRHRLSKWSKIAMKLSAYSHRMTQIMNKRAIYLTNESITKDDMSSCCSLNWVKCLVEQVTNALILGGKLMQIG
jgi:hypothetical protein